MEEDFVPFGRDCWDITDCFNGGLPKLKKRIVCPACGAGLDSLWFKEWRVFKRKTFNNNFQYRMDISIKCEECALVTGQDRVCMTHNDVAFGVHLTKEEYERFINSGNVYLDYTKLGRHVKLKELYVGDK